MPYFDSYGHDVSYQPAGWNTSAAGNYNPALFGTYSPGIAGPNRYSTLDKDLTIPKPANPSDFGKWGKLLNDFGSKNQGLLAVLGAVGAVLVFLWGRK